MLQRLASATDGQSFPGLRERNHDAVAVYLHTFIYRAGTYQFLPVNQLTRTEEQPFGHCLLVQRVDVVPLTGIIRHSQSRIGNRLRHLELSLAQACPSTVRGFVLLGHIIGQLHQQEGHVGPSKRLTPTCNQVSQQSGIFPSPSGIVLALIPNRAFHFPIPQRINHPVIKPGASPSQVRQPFSILVGFRTVEPHFVLPSAAQFHRVVIPLQLIRLVGNNLAVPVHCRKFQRYHILAFHQHSCRHIILTWRPEVSRRAHKRAIDKHRVTVGHAPHIKFRMPPHHRSRQVDGLPIPHTASHFDATLVPCAGKFNRVPCRIIKIPFVPQA